MQGCRIGKHPIVPISWEYARLKRFEAREVAAVDEEQIVADTLFVSRASMELKRRFKFERSTQRAKLSDSRYPPMRHRHSRKDPHSWLWDREEHPTVPLVENLVGNLRAPNLGLPEGRSRFCSRERPDNRNADTRD